MKKEKLRYLFNYLVVVFERNYYWIGFSIFTYYLGFFLHTQRAVLKHTQTGETLLKIFDNAFVLTLVVAIATYTLIIALSNTNNYKARNVMFVSQTSIMIFLTIGYLEFNLATKDVSIGAGALLFIIYLTISNVLKGG